MMKKSPSPSPTRVASKWFSRQGSRPIWRGMRLELRPEAVSVIKRLEALGEKEHRLWMASSDPAKWKQTPEAKELYDTMGAYEDTLRSLVHKAFKRGHAGIYWSRSERTAKEFAERERLNAGSTTETYALLEGVDPGVGHEVVEGPFADEDEVTLPEGTPVKVRSISFWGTSLGEQLGSAGSLTVKAARVAKKWKKLPPGWTDESVTKFWKTLGKGTPEHKVWNCIYKMTGVFDEPGGFCGGLADWKDPGWRKKITKQTPEARATAREYWKAKIKSKGGKKASAARVAARYAAQLPLMDPLYNLREAAKELLLLEDHLGHAQKHCPDCIRKHLLTTEALLEEAVRLDTEGEMLGLLSPLPAQVRELWTAYQDGRPEHEIGQAARVLRKGLVEASADVRVAARKGPPMQMGSAALLKKQGLTPVDVWFGEAQPHRRPVIELNDMVQDRQGNLLYFAGVAPDGTAILGKTEHEAKRLHKQIIEGRKHHTTRLASDSPAALKFLQRLRGRGKGTLNINVLEEALPLMGWSIKKTTAALRIADTDSVKPLLEAMLNPSFVWGYTGTKEPKRIDFDSVGEAKAGLRKWQREAKKGKPPLHPPFKQFYYSEALYPVEEKYSGSRFQTGHFFDIVGLWLGVEAYEVTNSTGSSVLLPLKPDHRGRFNVDPLKWKMAKFWTWAYKNAGQEDAAAYLAELGAEEEQKITAPASARSLDNTGTCPACFNNVKLRGGRTIMRHGWQVQGQREWGSWGNTWHSGPCFGTGWPAFELSPEGTTAYRDSTVIPYRERVSKELAQTKRGETPLVVENWRTRKKETVEPADPRYKGLLDKKVREGERAVKDLDETIRTLDSRILGWKETQLPGRRASVESVANRYGGGSPLILQPDYGHGDAAVPGDEPYHPCQHGLPCEGGGGCGCGGK